MDLAAVSPGVVATTHGSYDVVIAVAVLRHCQCRRCHQLRRRQQPIYAASVRKHTENLCITRNTLDCDQSNYSSRIVFSHIPIEFGQKGISAIRSADPENPILEPNTE